MDRISGGRFMFGIGAGWNREEMENHGTDYRTRFTRMRESVIAELQRRAEEAGRGPIPVTVFGAKPEARLLDRLRDAGVTRSLCYLPPGEPGQIEQALDRLAEVAAEWAG